MRAASQSVTTCRSRPPELPRVVLLAHLAEELDVVVDLLDVLDLRAVLLLELVERRVALALRRRCSSGQFEKLQRVGDLALRDHRSPRPVPPPPSSPQAARKPTKPRPSAPAPALAQQRPPAHAGRIIASSARSMSQSCLSLTALLSRSLIVSRSPRVRRCASVARGRRSGAARRHDVHVLRRPGQAHARAGAGQPLALGLVGVRHEHRDRARRRQAARPSASRCRGRPPTPRRPRRSAARRRGLLDPRDPQLLRAHDGVAALAPRRRPRPARAHRAGRCRAAARPRSPSTDSTCAGHQVRDADEARPRTRCAGARTPPRATRAARSRRGS